MNIQDGKYYKNGDIQMGDTQIPVGSSKHSDVVALAAAGVITIAPYVPPTQAEIDAQQQAELDALNGKVMDTDLALKALALIVLDEINALRANAGLALRTPLQLKNAHRAKLDEIS